MPIVFIVMFVSAILAIGLIWYGTGSASEVSLAAGVVTSVAFLVSIGLSFAMPHRFTDILTMPAVAKLPTVVVIEATIDGHVVCETKTDVFTYLHIGQPGTQTVYRQQYNAWGLEINQDSGFVVKVVGP